MKRRAFNIVAAASLLVFIAAPLFWAQSYARPFAGSYSWSSGSWPVESRTVTLTSSNGRSTLTLKRDIIDSGLMTQLLGAGAVEGLIDFPYWLWMLTASPPLIIWIGLWRRDAWMKQLSVNICPRCGYDLRATPDRCPECGTPTEKAD